MKTNSKYREGILVESMVHYLKEKGYFVKENVPNLNRCADIAAINQKGEIIVFECKINDYKKAIQQLKTHRLCADHVYIVTFHKKISIRILNEINENGIGLIFIDNKGNIDYKEFCSNIFINKWNKGQELLKKYIKEVA